MGPGGVDRPGPAEGGDRSPGFHAIQLTAPEARRDITVFGYYAGPATRIVATSHGQRVTAHQARWSVDPTVVLFYFTADQVPGDAGPQRFAALGRDGTRLPTGNAQAGVG